MRPPNATSSVAFEGRFHARVTRPPLRPDAFGAGAEFLRDASERDDRQMPPSPASFEHEFEPGTGLPSYERLRPRASRRPGPSSTRLESWLPMGGHPVEVDLVRCRPAKEGVRPDLVEPGDVLAQLPLELLKPKGEEQQPDALVLQGANEPLNDGEAAVLPDGSEALADASTATPRLELAGRELRPVVGDQVIRPTASTTADAVEERRDVSRRGLLGEHRDPHHLPGEVIDDDRDPSAERPSLGKREGEPGDPEPEAEGDGRQVGVPDVVRPLGGHHASSAARALGRDGLRFGPNHPTNGGCAEVQPGAGQEVRDPARAQGGADRSKLLDEVRDALWEAVHGLRDLEEGVGTAVIEAAGPGRDREWGDEEPPGGLRSGPAAGGPKGEDRQPLDRWVVRAPLGGETGHPGILDADLFYKEGDLLEEAVVFGLKTDADVEVVLGLRPGDGKSDSGHGDGMDHGGTDAAGPGIGKWNPRVGRRSRHDVSPPAPVWTGGLEELRRASGDGELGLRDR